MRIFIPSKGRPDTISTHKYLEQAGIDYRIVLHNYEESSYYVKNRSIDSTKLIVANVPDGVANIRNAILDMAEEGEWIMMLDDNIKRFTGISRALMDTLQEMPKNWSNVEIRKLFQFELVPNYLLILCSSMMELAEKTDAKLIGFSTTDNFFFRMKKIREVGFVVGKSMLIKKTDVRFDPNLTTMDDYGFTAENLHRFGKVLINNWIFAEKKHYQEGGIGNYMERAAAKKRDVQYLLAKYRGLFRINEKRKGVVSDSEVLINFHDVEQVEKWRSQTFTASK